MTTAPAHAATCSEPAPEAAPQIRPKRPVRIVIFAKAPQPGFAKTRLIAALGAAGAADLARRMLTHTVTEALASGVGTVELCVTPSVAGPSWPALQRSVRWSEQGDGDLGQRMARAAQRTLGIGIAEGAHAAGKADAAAGAEAVLLIGTDCPQLDRALLQRAANALQQADAVLLPTFDGGYALLGLNRFHRSLFENIAWSTDSVAFDTLRRIEHLDWSLQRLPMLHDIDEPADLKWVPRAWLDGQRWSADGQ